MDIEEEIVVDDFSDKETKFNQRTFEMFKRKVTELSDKYPDIKEFQRFTEELSKLSSFEDLTK
ncbi:MAG: hypothetical protein ACLRQ0_14250 [Monoglobales bacterium]